jgi:hypothetical protein
MLNYTIRLMTLCAVTTALALTTVSAYSQNVKEAGQKIREDNKGSVVTVKLVVNMKYSFPGSPSQEQEQKLDVTGVIVDPSGLAVLALSQSDPTSLFANQMPDGMDMEVELRSASYLLENGDEIDVERVMWDSDLDLAFFRPVEALDETLQHVDLSDSADAEILDQVLVVNRLGRVTNRAYSVSIEWIEAIMERPRTFYITGKQDTRSGLGCPAFALNGKVVGLLLLHTISGGDNPMDNITSVILPASDIADLIPEAMEAEVPEAEDKDDAEDEDSEG